MDVVDRVAVIARGVSSATNQMDINTRYIDCGHLRWHFAMGDFLDTGNVRSCDYLTSTRYGCRISSNSSGELTQQLHTASGSGVTGIYHRAGLSGRLILRPGFFAHSTDYLFFQPLTGLRAEPAQHLFKFSTMVIETRRA